MLFFLMEEFVNFRYLFVEMVHALAVNGDARVSMGW